MGAAFGGADRDPEGVRHKRLRASKHPLRSDQVDAVNQHSALRPKLLTALSRSRHFQPISERFAHEIQRATRDRPLSG